MARASVDGVGWRWREERAGSINPVTDEQCRQTSPSTLARRVAPLFGLGGVAALGQDRRGSSRFARSLPKPKNQLQRWPCQDFNRLLSNTGRADRLLAHVESDVFRRQIGGVNRVLPR